jgi:hypothetical protein
MKSIRLLNLLGGIIILVIAAWFFIPAIREGCSLLMLPSDSPKQLALEFAIGSLSLSGWVFVLILGSVGALLGLLGGYVLVSKESEG